MITRNVRSETRCSLCALARMIVWKVNMANVEAAYPVCMYIRPWIIYINHTLYIANYLDDTLYIEYAC